MSVLFLMAAASAAALSAAPSQPASAAPAGPPATTPLVTQGDPGLAPAPNAHTAGSVARPSAQATGASLAAGQSPSGVISYPASFFATYQPNTALDMVGRLPGFSLTTGDGSRGFASAGNALVDGARPSSKNDDIQQVLQRIPAGQVERIELIRGGAPGVDMQGQTVLANVIRKKIAATTGVLAVGDTWVVSDGRHQPIFKLEAQRRDGERLLEGSYVGSAFADDGAGKGTRTRRDATGALIENAADKVEADGVQHTLAGSYEQPAFGGKLRVNSQILLQRYYFDEYVDPKSPPIAGDVGSHERDHQNREELELGADYSRSFGQNLKLDTVLLQNVKGEDYLSLFDTPDEVDRFREQHTQGETVGRATLTWTKSPKLTIETGGETAYNWLASHTRFASNGAAIALPAANVDVSELRGEAFAKATYAFSPKLSAELGLRIEVSDISSEGDVVLEKTLVYPKPRLVVTWSPTAADQFRFRVEQEVGQLDFGDFVAASSLSTGQILAGNPDLVPQQATVFEAAWERRFLGSGAATVTYRHSELTDVVDRAPVISDSGIFDAPANIGDGTKDELLFDLNVPLDRFHIPGGLLKANATLRDSQVLDPATGRMRPISGLRPTEGQINFSQDLPKRKLKWGGGVFAGFQQRYYRFNQVETDTFHPLGSLFIEYKPRPDLSLRWELNEIGVDYRRRLTVVNGLRGRDPVAFTEARALGGLGPFAYFRIRKTF